MLAKTNNGSFPEEVVERSLADHFWCNLGIGCFHAEFECFGEEGGKSKMDPVPMFSGKMIAWR